MPQKIVLSRLQADLNKYPFTGTAECYQRAGKVVEYCHQNQRTSPYAHGIDDITAVFTVTHFGITPLNAWSDDKVKAYFASHIKPPSNRDDDEEESVYQMIGTARFDLACANLLSSKFIASPRNETTLQLYDIESWDKRQVVPLGDKPSDRNVAVARAVSPALHDEGVGVTPKLMEAMTLAFMANVTLVDAPKLLGQPNEDAWCLHRATVLPDASVAFPNIRKFTDRLNDSVAFGAWVWGVYSGENLGRQILYISDRRGEGGKSKIIAKLIQALFGDRISTSFGSNKIAANNPHASSAFIGKKMVVIGDNRNPWIIHTVMLKELSGDDKSFVNPKYQQPFATSFECRVLIASNYDPAITSEQHNKSRTLWLILEPLTISDAERDPHYGEKCVAELPGFLAWAKQCYAERCLNNYAIQVNEKVRLATQRRIAQCESQYSVPFDDHFVLDEDGTLPSREWAHVARELHHDPHISEDFRNWVLAVHPTITEHYDPKKPTKWWLEGVRKRRGTDHWQKEGQPPSGAGDAASEAPSGMSDELSKLYAMENAE